MQLQRVFRTRKPPAEWMGSNIALIPKIEEPNSPKDYRPITIGNVMYRLLMKIITTRLQKHMGIIISNSQTAFLKGRCISDNVILVREILHSFGSSEYKEEGFMLKADIAKAFDTVRWSFIWAAMRMVNMPRELIQLVKECMEMGRVTVLINGHGDGFIKPTRGLRQGCPLSPYLFILVMECLTKKLKQASSVGGIKGITLSQTARPLNHAIYADDLVVMGLATVEEGRAFMGIFEHFASYSGLVVNPEKSSVWFSKRCSARKRQEMLQVLQARMAQPNERYLGIVLSQGRSQQKNTGQMLLKKFQGRLAGWKVNMLSHAGRTVLIKSVLCSVPVYYMAVEKLSNKAIDELEGLMRRFMWGKIGRERYLPMIAWHKLCQIEEEGGLGIKDLKIFNKALIQKVVWQLVTNQDRVWVGIIKAKYFPQNSFWSAEDKQGTSNLWKALLENKNEVLIHTIWHIGDGKEIAVQGQPWYEQGVIQGGGSTIHLKVTTLYDHSSKNWKTQLIMDIMGQEVCYAVGTTPGTAAGIKRSNDMDKREERWLHSQRRI